MNKTRKLKVIITFSFLCFVNSSYGQLDSIKWADRMVMPDEPLIRSYLYTQNLGYPNGFYKHKEIIKYKNVYRITYYLIHKGEQKILEEEFDDMGLKTKEFFFNRDTIIKVNNYIYDNSTLAYIDMHDYAMDSHIHINKESVDFYLYPLAREPYYNISFKNGMAKFIETIGDKPKRYRLDYTFKPQKK